MTTLTHRLFLLLIDSAYSVAEATVTKNAMGVGWN